MTAMDRWFDDFPYHMQIDRTNDVDRYVDFSKTLKLHDIKFMLMGVQVGFQTIEDLSTAQLLY